MWLLWTRLAPHMSLRWSFCGRECGGYKQDAPSRLLKKPCFREMIEIWVRNANGLQTQFLVEMSFSVAC
jgi:hypothetical protein